uniref:Variant surface glycoprotein n=1 Tax=Trypanosoma brucei TaxID=5691 RepID=A0A1V0FYH5_9TRYP|nr:variant surface glycoprotein [Trypanosoma brucei]
MQGAPTPKRFILGKINGAFSTGCDGDQPDANNGRCDAYRKQHTSTPGTTIPWVVELRTAADKLRTIQENTAKMHTINNRLRSLNQTLEALAKNPGKQAVTAATAPAKKPTHQAQESLKKQCEKFNNNETHCPTDSCEYDKTKNECKPKPGTETTEAAEGTGQTSSGVDCSKHQTQQACEAENKDVKPGQKSVCEWIYFVDGSGMLPKPECRSSSFLLKSKLALITITTFVILVEI